MKMSKILALALVLLVSMSTIAGSTIAWFTDSVTSANNIIQSGTLDVDVYRGNPDDADSIQYDATLFNGVKLWEPGAVAWENLTVVNKGSLAFKYEMTVNGINENKMTDGTEACLSQILQVGYVDGGIAAGAKREEVLASVKEWKSFAAFKEEGILLPVENDHIKAENKLVDGKAIPVGEKTYGMVICWQPTDEDNKWNVNNGKETDDQKPYLHIDLGINLKASQFTAESDSFDHMYDEDVESPIYPTFSTVKEAMDYFAGLEEQVTTKIPLRKDEMNANTTLSVKEGDDLIIDLLGHKLTVSNVTDNDCIVVNTGATLTITDSIGGGELHVMTSGNNDEAIFVQNSKEGTTSTLNLTGDAKIVLKQDEDGDWPLNTIQAKAEKGKAIVNIKEDAHIYVEGWFNVGIDVYENAAVNMSGGSITAVYTYDNQDGCVYGAYLEDETSEFNMSGGVITVDGLHCTSGIYSCDSAATINVTGGTFYVMGQVDTDRGFNTAIDVGSTTKLNISGAEFYINASSETDSKIRGTAALIGRDVATKIGNDVKVYATNGNNGNRINLAFCDYNSILDFSLNSLGTIHENSSGGIAGRLDGSVTFEVGGVQLTNDNYSTIFGDMIEWQLKT